MNTAKAWYWIALGIVALGLNSEYQQGDLPGMHRIAARAESAFCHVATRAEQTFAVAKFLMSSPMSGPARAFVSPGFPSDDQVLAMHQAELDRAQARLDAFRASLERAQADRVRARDRFAAHLSAAANRRMVVVCPETGQRIEVAVPDLSDLDSEIRDIQVDDSF